MSMRAAKEIRNEIEVLRRTSASLPIFERRAWLTRLLSAELMLDVRELLKSRLRKEKAPSEIQVRAGGKSKTGSGS